MFGYIYKTTDLLNGKIYIGQHSKDNFDKYYIGSGRKLLLRLKEIGRKNFKTEILEWCETQQKLIDRETYWIKYYNSTDPNIGYNVLTNAFKELKIDTTYYCVGLSFYYNKELDKEIRLHQDEEIPEGFVKGRRPFSAETNKKKAKYGKDNGMYGVHRYGEKNPCYGRKWCYNPETMETKYLKKDEELPKGFIYGNIKNIKHEYIWIHKNDEIKQIKINDFEKYKEDGWKRGIKDKKIKKLLTKEEISHVIKKGWEKRKQKKLICPYCGKLGQAPGIYKNHFERCKYKGDNKQ